MKKHLAFLLLLSAFGCLAQSASRDTYAELPDPQPADQASWALVQPGFYVRFASADVRFPKRAAPAPQTVREGWNPQAWKGEKIHTQIVIWSQSALPQTRLSWSELKDTKGNTIPKDRVTAGFVRYVMTDRLPAEGGGCDERPPGKYDSSLVADPIDLTSVLDIPRQTTQPVWLSVSVPPTTPAGQYSGTVTVGGSAAKPIDLSYRVTVQNRTLPPPKDWKFHLDLWQNPYSVARAHGVKVWSKEHWTVMRPYMKMLADAGQKSITTTIINDPWRSQTEDVYGSMVQWTKKKDGTWAFDYTVFDQWVTYMMELGIDRFINCYSMIPWNLKFSYYDEAARKDTFLIAKTGTPEYDAHWRPMLTDFARHLKQKGWFEKTTIAMDERPMESMQQALALIKSVDQNFRVSLAGLYHPELEQNLIDYCVATNQVIDAPTLQRRRQAGFNTTYYTCCTERYPNTFTFSPPAEATWISWHAAHKGYDGYLRWAYNCWVKNPLQDSRFRTWPAGDTYIVYPGPRTSIRFERLIEGIQDYEKIRILKGEFRAKGQTDKAQQLEKVLNRFEISALDKTPAATLLQPAKTALNSF
ncbi:DUF4091 domain-containing protein [Larkinella humicola]|uniref:DUF4091 domain-containing protein n=1 Tax=Larkinella humicola TaxID=2607654 RepID=A0A5N1JBH5_9BACT|nr:DUF4091 domain-containing protein [Larkinella humicola]KAA9349831.1 DUF4091 domain-containing protein [Larkinella humicola]